MTLSSASARSAALSCILLASSAAAIDAPVATSATALAADGFTANWTAVAGATGYELDLFLMDDPIPTTVTEGFDTYDASDATIPEGWTITGTLGISTSSGNSGIATPSVKLNGYGDLVASPVFPGVLTNIAFYAKGVRSGNSTLSVEGLPRGGSAGDWMVISTHSILTSGGDYNCSLPIDPQWDIGSVRLVFDRIGGTVYIDDISVVYDAENLTTVATDIDAGSSLSYAVSGLSVPGTYRYMVRATDGTDTSDDSNAVEVEVTGLSPDIVGPGGDPVLLSATAVGNDGISVFWSMVEDVDGYSINIAKRVSTPAVRATEGFTGYAGNAATVPEGWTLSEYGCYDSNASSGSTGPNSVKFTTDGAMVVSPFYDEAITNVSFWAKAMSGAGPATSATLETRNSPDSGWVLIATNSVTTSGRTFSNDIDREWDMRQFRIIYNMDGKNAAFDDFSVGYGGDYAETVVPWAGVSGAASTNYVATGLEAGDYEVVLHAVKNGLTSLDTETAVVRVGVLPPAAPEAFEATDVSSSGFTANWGEVENATGYELDVTQAFQSQAVRVTEGFDGYEGGTTGVPQGWDLSAGLAEAAESSGYYMVSPGVKLTARDMYVETCEYPAPVTNLSFMAKGSAQNSTFSIQGLDSGLSWHEIVADESLSSSKRTLTFNIARALDIRRIRIVYNAGGGGYMAIDDVSVGYGGTYFETVLSAQEIQGGGVTNYAVTGLSDGDFSYVVRSTNPAGTSGNSNPIEVRVGDPPHQPPVIAEIAAQTVRLGGRLEVALDIAQEDGDEIAATNVVPPVALAGEYGWTASGAFWYEPLEADVGTKTFTFTAESAGGESLPVTMAVTVKHAIVSAIPFSAAGRLYEQDFDALGSEWDDLAWPLPAWHAQVGSATATEFKTTATTAGIHRYGAEGDWAMGSLAGSGNAVMYGVAFTNDTADAIRSVSVAFHAAQYRVGGSNNGANTLSFSWRVAQDGGAEFGGEGWNEVAALAYQTTATASDDSTLNAQVPRSATIPVLVRPGEVLVLRWSDPDDAGNDHSMGIDDLSVTWSHQGGTLLLFR